MNEYYRDLKEAVKALESYMTSLEKEDYDYLSAAFKRIADIQRNYRP